MNKLAEMKYASKLPQRTYATTLEEQLEQLETDELVVRFAASRERLSSDRYRPAYHYVPPEGPTNDDPYRFAGSCLWKGEKGYYCVTGSYRGQRYVDAAPNPHLFFSDDLRNWTYRGLFVEGDIFTTAGEDCACPYFWPFGDKHILVFCSHQRGSQYLIGDWDEDGVFRPFAHDRFCFGANNKRYMTVRVHPFRENSLGISLHAQGKDALLLSLDAWRMKRSGRKSRGDRR